MAVVAERVLFSAGKTFSLLSDRTQFRIFVFLPSHPFISAVSEETWGKCIMDNQVMWIGAEKDIKYPCSVQVIKNSFSLGILISKINRMEGATVIGGGSSLFYSSVPHIKNHVKKIEWCFTNQWITPVEEAVKLFHKRVFNTRWLLDDVKKTYTDKNVENRHLRTLHFLEDAFELPDRPNMQRNTVGPLKVLYVDQKPEAGKITLLEKIAARTLKSRIVLKLYAMSERDVKDMNSDYVTSIPFPAKYGVWEEVMREMDVLLMISPQPDPIILKAMMSLGKVVVASAVDFVPDYIQDGVNGYLIPKYDDVGKTAEDCFIALSILAGDKPTYLEMSDRNAKISSEIFDGRMAAHRWQQLISENN